MLVRNYRVYASMHGIAVDDSIVENGTGEEEDASMDLDGDAAAGNAEDDTWDGMDVDGDETRKNENENDDNNDNEIDDDLPAFFKETSHAPPPKTPSRRKRTKVDELVRAKVLRVLGQLDLSDRRARQCDETDFLKLLDAVSYCPPGPSGRLVRASAWLGGVLLLTDTDEQRGHPLLVRGMEAASIPGFLGIGLLVFCWLLLIYFDRPLSLHHGVWFL